MSRSTTIPKLSGGDCPDQDEGEEDGLITYFIENIVMRDAPRRKIATANPASAPGNSSTLVQAFVQKVALAVERTKIVTSMLNWMLVMLGRFIEFGFVVDWYRTSGSLSRAVSTRESEPKLFRMAEWNDQDACRTPGRMRLSAPVLNQKCCASAPTM